MIDDSRAVLEGIAYGDDPAIKPSDRVAALRQLREMDSSDEAALLLARDVMALDDAAAAVEKELRGLTARAEPLPEHLEEEVERRVASRVEQRLEELRRSGELRPPAPPPEVQPDDHQPETEEPAAEHPPNPAAPPGLSPEDVAVAWTEGRASAPEPVRVGRGRM